jgi:hypothetical protein
MISVDSGDHGVTVESVEKLYAQHLRMDVPEYYFEGGVNPFEGRVRVIPRKAAFYSLVPEDSVQNIELARKLLRGARPRRKIREVICEKHEINFNQFAKVGRIMVLYV